MKNNNYKNPIGILLLIIISTFSIISCDKDISKNSELTLLLNKYLPDYTIKINSNHKYHYDPHFCLFSPDKKEIELKYTWSIEEGEEYLNNPSLTKFLQKHPIKITTNLHAIELTRLIHGILSGPYMLGKNWTQTAERINNKWIVSFAYIGPPVMIPEPPIYEIRLNNNNEIIDIKLKHI